MYSASKMGFTHLWIFLLYIRLVNPPRLGGLTKFFSYLNSLFNYRDNDIVTTTENLAVVIYEGILSHLPKETILHEIKVYETDKNIVVFRGDYEWTFTTKVHLIMIWFFDICFVKYIFEIDIYNWYDRISLFHLISYQTKWYIR